MPEYLKGVVQAVQAANFSDIKGGGHDVPNVLELGGIPTGCKPTAVHSQNRLLSLTRLPPASRCSGRSMDRHRKLVMQRDALWAAVRIHALSDAANVLHASLNIIFTTRCKSGNFRSVTGTRFEQTSGCLDEVPPHGDPRVTRSRHLYGEICRTKPVISHPVLPGAHRAERIQRPDVPGNGSSHPRS